MRSSSGSRLSSSSRSSFCGKTGGEDAGAGSQSIAVSHINHELFTYGLMVVQQRKRAHRLQHPVRACDSRQEGHGLQQTCWVVVVN